MNPTHLIILNRTASAAGWIHIVPKGELPNREAGLVQVLDDVSLDSILAHIASDRQRLGPNWPGIYAGREHFIYNDEQDSAALAWFKEFEKRDNGIWAKDDGLTPMGKQVIANAEYKFTSFVADRRDTQSLEGNRVRILKLDTIGFTNQANGKELLTPITNRNNFPGSREPADSTANPQQKAKHMKSVCSLLGLSAEADEASVHAAVTKLQNRLSTLEPFETEVTTLKNRLTALDGEQVDGLLDLHQVKEEKLRNRLKPVLVGMATRADRIAALMDFGHKPAEAAKPAAGTGRVLNRADAKPAAAAAPEADEEAQVQKAEAEITNYRLANRCSYGDARNAVRLQKPELFGLARA